MISDCLNCSEAILTPDGILRCDIDFKIAKGICDKIEYGKFRLYKPEPFPRIEPKPKRKRRQL